MRHKLFPLVVLLLGALFFSAMAPRPPRTENRHKLIYRVTDVQVRELRTSPPRLQITARGRTRTGGWSDPELRGPRPRANGVYEFRFVAQPPEGMSTQALTPIRATVTIPRPPNYRGVRIISASNSKTNR